MGAALDNSDRSSAGTGASMDTGESTMDRTSTLSDSLDAELQEEENAASYDQRHMP
jgi:hypothetical protein